MKIEVNELKSIQDVIKYLNDYATPDSDIIKCISVLQEYAESEQLFCKCKLPTNNFQLDNGTICCCKCEKEIAEGNKELKTVYMAGEICMWDEIKEENRRLKFIVENGLGEKDLENDCT